ncbi:MAG TPA: DNA-processing protein DprA [Candidatus Limnocylindrales bacterium]|nr:DNA-processing protein DprA [Candidatus Limnocylindrales bacterium]
MGGLDPEERAAWISLSLVEGVGLLTFGRLVGHFGGAAPALAAIRAGRLGPLAAELRLRHVVRAALVQAAADPQSLQTPLRRLGLWTLTPLDERWPARLRGLADPPVTLHGWGEVASLEAVRAVAVVGTRRPTPAGRLLASRLGDRLAEVGVVVVSGLAIGIDGAAHAAVVARGGRTVAVIGAGHRAPGPRAHRRLMRDIVDSGGAVVSELGPLAAATRGTYPRRNRILSGLADTVMVVEAPARSGAINTAHHALEQGRNLLVAPGRPGEVRTAGCLRLLRETEARPLIGLDEALADAGIDPRLALAPGPEASPRRHAEPGQEGLGPAERAVAQRLGAGPADLDQLVAATGLAPATVASALGLLQLRGWAQASGATYLPAGPLLAGA